MDWKIVGKICYQTGLFIIEWGFKLCALVAGWLTLGAQGSFGMKLATGFGSLSTGLRRLFELPVLIKEMSWAVREYQRIGLAEFQETYGLLPIEQVLGSLSGIFTYVRQISINFSDDPLSTLTATLLVFSAFYVLGRIIRFARQRGRGAFMDRIERRIGDKVFNRVNGSMSRKISQSSSQNNVNKAGQSWLKLT